MRASGKRKSQPSGRENNIWRNHIWGPNRLFYGIGIITILSLGIFAFSQWYAKPVSPAQNAWTACTMFVVRQIGVSANDAQPFDPSFVKFLSDNSYQVDLNYVKNNIAYTCATKNLPDGTWQLISLKVK